MHKTYFGISKNIVVYHYLVNNYILVGYNIKNFITLGNTVLTISGLVISRSATNL